MHTTIIPDDLITPIEAAELLKVSDGSIRRWVKSGKLPAFELVGRVRISKADVFALLKRVETSGPALPTRKEAEAKDRWVDQTLRDARIRRPRQAPKAATRTSP